MPSDSKSKAPDPGPRSNPADLKPPSVTARRFLFVLLLGSLLLVGAVFWPMAEALLMAAVLAVVLERLQRGLTAKLRGRNQLAAGILVFAVLVLLIGPLIGLSAFALNEASAGVRFVLETVRGEGMTRLIERLPGPLARYAGEAIARLGDLGQTIEAQISSYGGMAASAVGAALMATGSLIFQGTMMLIALFFLLVGGDALLGWMESVSPLHRGHTRELLAEFKKVAYSVIVSTLITSGAQAVAALAGYLITGVPHPIFFAIVTFFVAMIPAIGAAAVCVFAALILLVTGHPYMALFLAIWGVAVVGLVDNVAKPFLMKGDVEMDGAVVFFALIGGIAAFGMVGLLIGPLAVALFLALLRIYERDFLAGA
jgi:predicted PurR-regulated permease PerM